MTLLNGMNRPQMERNDRMRPSVRTSTLMLFASLVLVLAAAGCGGGGGEDGDGGGTPTPDAGDATPDARADATADATTDARADATTDARADATTDTNSPGEDSQTRPRSQADQVLEPEGLAVTDGVGLGAARGSIDHPVVVSVGRPDTPTSETPLPAEASAVGEFAELSADRDVRIAADQGPLLLVLPVPGGAEASNLALAILSEDGNMTGDERPLDAPAWTVAPGMYAPGQGLFIVPIRFLRAEGTTFTLVESDAYDTPSLPGSSGSDDAETGADRLVAEAIRTTVDAATSFLESGSKRDDFYVVCRGFTGDGCGSAKKEQVRQQLQTAESDFASGFRKPALRRTLPGRTVDGTEGRFYRYVLRPKESSPPCVEGNGYYEPLTGVAITCHDPSSQEAPPVATTRMEYMHAVQFAYPFFDDILGGESDSAWILKGPAAFAKNETSGAEQAVRWAGGADGLRNIDTPLTAQTAQAPFPAAGTQDFWVYLIESRDSSPKEVLSPLWKTDLDRAPNLQDVSGRYDLTAAHWGWVRNQAFEARVTDGNSDLDGTCVPNSNAWNTLHRTLTHNTTDQRGFRTRLELSGDWTAGVVKVEFTNGLSEKVKAIFDGDSDSGYLKAFPSRSSAEKHCLHRNETPSTTEIDTVLEPRKTWVSYLLLSNSARSSSDKRSYDVAASFTRASSDQQRPEVVLERPPAVGYPLKRDTLFLKADASDPGGGFVEPLVWRVEGSGGTSKTYRGDDLAIEDFWSEGFQPGTFTIDIHATDDDGQQTNVSYQVAIEQK